MFAAGSNSAGPQMSRYISRIAAVPLISPEEELALARRWLDHQDKRAAGQLIEAHLRLVVKIAAGYRRYGAPFEELVAEGNLGLMQAIKRFDPDHGARFSTYATWWIRAAIQDYVMRNSSIVRMGTTGAQKKLFFNLRRAKRLTDADEEGDLLPEHATSIADMLDVPAQEVISMNRRMAAPDSSLNATLTTTGSSEWQDWLADESDSQEQTIADEDERLNRLRLLNAALRTLSDRERHIITERRLKEQPVTMQVLATQYGISPERIRQIEEKAVVKLRRAMANKPVTPRVRIAGVAASAERAALPVAIAASMRRPMPSGAMTVPA